MRITAVHHPLTDVQPIPRSNQLLLANSFNLFTGQDNLWYGKSLGPVLVSCPGHAPSQLFVHLLHWESIGNRKVLDLE